MSAPNVVRVDLMPTFAIGRALFMSVLHVHTQIPTWLLYLHQQLITQHLHPPPAYTACNAHTMHSAHLAADFLLQSLSAGARRAPPSDVRCCVAAALSDYYYGVMVG